MNDPIVVTNLRIPKSDLLQVRIRAAELGISANEYIKRLIQNESIHTLLVPAHDKRTDPIWHLPKSVMQLKNKEQPYELSEDDKIIYGIE